MKGPQTTIETTQKNPGLNQDILSDLHNTKQTQTQFLEIQNKLPTLESMNGESEIKSKKSNSKSAIQPQNEESDDQIIDMEEIEEMISGSGLDFGKKVKSDYMHSRIDNIENSNAISSHSKKSRVLNDINAQSGVYETDQKKSKFVLKN